MGAVTSMSAWTELYPGIEHATGVNQTIPLGKGYPTTNVNILKVALTNPAIELFVTPWASLRTAGLQTSAFLNEHFNRNTMAAMLAVNANYFDVATSNNRNVAYGLCVSQGELVSFAYSEQGPFGVIFTPENYAVMAMTPATYDTFAGTMSGRRPWNAVGGGPYLLQGGNVVSNDSTEVAARTGIGLSGPGPSGLAGYPQYLYLLTIDGLEIPPEKPNVYYGATYQDAAEWLQYAGASEGLNLDGGGSSTMAYIDAAAFAKNGAVLLNVPHDKEQDPTPIERAVCISFAVIVRAPAAG